MTGLEHDTDLLKRLAKFSRMPPSKIAKEAGLAATTILRSFNGTSPSRLSAPTIEKLKAAFPDFPDWSGQEVVRRSAESELVEVAGIDLSFGLGPAFMDSEIVDYQAERLTFPRSWLRQITTSPPDQLYWTRGVGNSMEPSIGDGDVILIDRSIVGTSFGDLYWAIAYGQTGMIKRLRPMPDGSVKILSDNPSVPPEIAYDSELHVFGRVVAVIRKV